MKQQGIYIAGSDMNAGKTTFSLGMISWLCNHLDRGASFMKPLGQKTTLLDGASVGEDSFLVNTSLGLHSELKYATPFAMSSGASEKFLEDGHPVNIRGKILKAFRHLAADTDMVVVEGTGHPGVGSVFGLCNASVASLLDIPVLLVLDAGIGRTIDRFTLCNSLFHDRKIPLLGVVVNRVRKSKMEKVKKYLDPWFSERGIPVFGYIPYVTSIARPSLSMLGRELGLEAVISWKPDPYMPVEGFITAFGSIREILIDINENPDSALLISATRLEVIDALITRRLSGVLEKGPGAIVICGSFTEHDSYLVEACRKLDIPVYRTAKNAGDSASILNRRVFKVEPGESVKISEIVETVRDNVDLESILDALLAPVIVPGKPKQTPLLKVRSWFSKLLRG